MYVQNSSKKKYINRLTCQWVDNPHEEYGNGDVF